MAERENQLILDGEAQSFEHRHRVYLDKGRESGTTPDVQRTPEEVEEAIRGWQRAFAGVDLDDGPEDTEEYEKMLTDLLESDWAGTVRQLRQGEIVLEPAAVTAEELEGWF